ncbi:unnamed protein product [Closterium sp. NIES-54]
MVQQILQRFGFTYSSPQSTPLPTGHSLSAPPSDDTSGMGLVLGGRARVVLSGHADAFWVDDLATQWLSQCYTFSLGSGSVSWRSTRSSSVLSSSCEAEIYAGAMAAQELRWLTYLLTDLGEAPRSPPVPYVDNKAMLALCQEHRLEHRTKHIALRYFLARELQQRGQLCLAYVGSQTNTADVFNKARQPWDHQRFCTVLGLPFACAAGGVGGGGATAATAVAERNTQRGATSIPLLLAVLASPGHLSQTVSTFLLLMLLLISLLLLLLQAHMSVLLLPLQLLLQHLLLPLQHPRRSSQTHATGGQPHTNDRFPRSASVGHSGPGAAARTAPPTGVSGAVSAGALASRSLIPGLIHVPGIKGTASQHLSGAKPYLLNLVKAGRRVNGSRSVSGCDSSSRSGPRNSGGVGFDVAPRSICWCRSL